MPEQLPPDDPVTSRPMAGLVLISVFILMLTVSWSLYDEFYGLRPWRKYQAEFSSAYSNYLDKQYKQRRADEQKFYATPEYLKLRGRREGRHRRRSNQGPGNRPANRFARPPARGHDGLFHHFARPGRLSHLSAGANQREGQERQGLQAQGTERSQSADVRRGLAGRGRQDRAAEI